MPVEAAASCRPGTASCPAPLPACLRVPPVPGLPLQADTIEPASPGDLAFFWGVWYCLRLSAPHAERLAAAVRGLLAAEGGLQQQAGDAATAAAVEALLREWLQPAPAVEALEAERQRMQASRAGAGLPACLGVSRRLAWRPQSVHGSPR